MPYGGITVRPDGLNCGGREWTSSFSSGASRRASGS